MKTNHQALNPSLVLEKAVLNTASLLEIRNCELASIIGVSDSTVSRLGSHKSKGINPDSKEGEIALLFIRVFRSLDAFLGSVIENEKRWLRAYNKAFNTTPIDAMKTITGLIQVVQYLDAIRGKI